MVYGGDSVDRPLAVDRFAPIEYVVGFGFVVLVGFDFRVVSFGVFEVC